MFRILGIAAALVITSMFYFPFSFTVFPVANTKLVLAMAGLVIWGVELSMHKVGSLSKELIVLSAFAVVFSLVCLFSVTYNGTADYAYTSYIASMWVWLAGAYAVCRLIRTVHGEMSFRTLSHYLIAVCAIQCFLALWIDHYPAFKSFVDAHIIQDQEFLTKVHRLYGIGAMLDTAGIRFSVALILLAQLITSRKTGERNLLTLLYLIVFVVLTVIGNMIARTTSVGAILGLLLMAYRQVTAGETPPFSMKELIIGMMFLICVCAPVVAYFYNTNAAFHKNLRFGFEGIFNLMEKGRWEIGSNEQLKNMIVFPGSLKTWLIGDGYFNNPVATDPYFVGKVTGGYYMGTDIGYLRFIFYCGIIGLMAFSFYICKVAAVCMKHLPSKKAVLLLLVVLNFIVWLKVSTDIFLIFALLLMVDVENTDRKTTETANTNADSTATATSMATVQ